MQEIQIDPPLRRAGVLGALTVAAATAVVMFVFALVTAPVASAEPMPRDVGAAVREHLDRHPAGCRLRLVSVPDPVDQDGSVTAGVCEQHGPVGVTYSLRRAS